MRDADAMVDESKIATHDSPVGRSRSNYMIRVNLDRDGMPDHYEQMWTRTEDSHRHELCCIPFFTYGLSLGDVVTMTDAYGGYRVESKSGHRTIRFAIQSDAYAHEGHEGLHGGLTDLGVLTEFRGHARGYCAVASPTKRRPMP
ncbi:MAG: DUF4265 domain-containing protein [Mycobacteriaceae bacterium]